MQIERPVALKRTPCAQNQDPHSKLRDLRGLVEGIPEAFDRQHNYASEVRILQLITELKNADDQIKLEVKQIVAGIKNLDIRHACIHRIISISEEFSPLYFQPLPEALVSTLPEALVSTLPEALVATLPEAPVPTPPVAVAATEKRQAGETEFVNTTLNLTLPPVFEPQFTGLQEITIGDLHGNPLSLLHYLVKSGVLEFKGTKDEHGKFNDVIARSSTAEPLSREQTSDFQEILKKFVPAQNNHAHVRLLGDMFVDRISNNDQMLDVLELLNNYNIDYEINFSNHDSYFVAEFCFGFHLLEDKTFGFQPRMSKREYASLGRLMDVIGDKRDEFVERFNRFYLPKLKLLSYYKNEAGQECLFSHSILLNRAIQKFIKRYDEEMKVSGNEIFSSDSLEEQVNKINSTFSFMLKPLPDTTKPKDSKLLADFLGLNEKGIDSPVHMMIWIRPWEIEKQERRKHGMVTFRILDAETPMPRGTQCFNGHSPGDMNAWGRTHSSLDGTAGKCIEQFRSTVVPGMSDRVRFFCAFKPDRANGLPKIC